MYSVTSHQPAPDRNTMTGSVFEINKKLSDVLSEVSVSTSFTVRPKRGRGRSSTYNYKPILYYCPKAVYLLSVIPDEFLTSKYKSMYPMEINFEINFDDPDYERRMWSFLISYPIDFVDGIHLENDNVVWLYNVTVEDEDLDVTVRDFFQGKTFQLILFLAILPHHVISDAKKLIEILNTWTGYYGVKLSNHAMTDMYNRVFSIMIEQRKSQEGKNAISRCIESTIAYIMRTEIQSQLMSICNLMHISSTIPNTVRFAFLVLFSQAKPVQARAFEMVKKRVPYLCPEQYTKLAYNMRVLQHDFSILLFVLLQMPSSFPHTKFQAQFKNALYYDVEDPNDPRLRDIGRQALCFCSTHVVKIWKRMDWPLDPKYKHRMKQLASDKWTPQPAEIADLVLMFLNP
ncbi:MAG: hypothetical protein ACTSUE_18095 [Promethearchaeota archaeon]